MLCIPMQIKFNKSLSRQGMGLALSFTEKAAVSSHFLHTISVVRVNLSHPIHNAADTAGQCPNQMAIWLPTSLTHGRLASLAGGCRLQSGFRFCPFVQCIKSYALSLSRTDENSTSTEGGGGIG